MFDHFVIKNFRCFAGLHLKQLGRVNLIAGKNNTGKTAVLEAIHLHNNPADCELPLAINKGRGIEMQGRAVEDIVGWLFWNKQTAVGLDVNSWDDKGVTRTLTMRLLSDAATSREQFPDAEKLLSESFHPQIVAANLPRLIMTYEQTNQPEQISIGVFGGGSLGWIGAKVPWRIASIYLSSNDHYSDLDMRHFGELESAKRLDEILPALRIIEPRLQRLALVPLSAEPVIHGDIGLPRLVPISFMGDGVRRVLSIVLAIANAAGGVVLIDEIENGLHYSVQKQVWQAIAQAARRLNVQVFATTHSWECLVKAHEAFADDEVYDLRWHRLQDVRGEIQAISHDREMIEAALCSGVEIR
jgi:hypothetical protein